jgi:hypothetical protein
MRDLLAVILHSTQLTDFSRLLVDSAAHVARPIRRPAKDINLRPSMPFRRGNDSESMIAAIVIETLELISESL